jgi:glycosyltransferase involved in cell wall biosynthesis
VLPSEAPSVGIGVPFYRDLDLLDRALRSLIGQDDAAWTAVVVDDASPDAGAAAVVDRLVDERVRYVRNDSTVGVAANFERCFDLVGGVMGCDVAVILHADDELDPRFVGRVRALHAERPDIAAVATGVVVIDAAGDEHLPLGDRVKRWLWPRGSHTFDVVGDAGLARVLTGLFWYCPAMSYRLERLPERRWDARWSQVMDLDLYGRMLLGDATIVLLDEPLYRYRRHANTTTAANTATLVRTREECQVIAELAAAAGHRGWRRSVRSGRWRVTHRANAIVIALAAVGRGDLSRARQALLLALGHA